MNYRPDFVSKYKFDDKRTVKIDIYGISFNFQIFENRSKNKFNVGKLRRILKEFLEIIKRYPKVERTKINILVYDIPFKKRLPSKRKAIEPKHINSGYCYITSNVDDTNIVIFRREEFYKVLIHELLHFFDIFPYNQDLQTIYANMFSSVSTLRVEEAIVELHAMYINCEIISRLKNIEENKLIESEYKFSIIQCKKVLEQQDVDFSDIVKNTFTWNETTNAFSYFILKHIFFHFTLKKSMDELYNKLNERKKSSKNLNIRLSKNSI